MPTPIFATFDENWSIAVNLVATIAAADILYAFIFFYYIIVPVQNAMTIFRIQVHFIN
jgi:hypothetical protein